VLSYFKCIGKLDAEAFLHDPRLIVDSRDIPKVNRCMCPIVDWTSSWREKKEMHSGTCPSQFKCMCLSSLAGLGCKLVIRLGVG
jgi:hypothetical protein